MAGDWLNEPFEPWIVYGQTAGSPNTAVDNPAANNAGAIGSASWPFVVPTGYTLMIESWGPEGYPVPGPVGMFLWAGELPAANAKALHTVMADNTSRETVGARYFFPAGAKINMRLMFAESPQQVVGWFASGRLIPDPAM